MLYSISSVLFITISYSVFLFVKDHKLLLLSQEDGFFETFTALFFLGASIFFLISFVRNKNGNDFLFIRTRKNYFLLVLGVVFFLGFGEEISWGQRIFGLQAPEMLEKINLQNEINIHNISIFHGKTEAGDEKSFWAKLLNIDRLFSIFWFSYCLIIPIITKFSMTIYYWLKKINLPIIPIWLGIFFLINYVISKIIELNISSVLHHSLAEIKECNFSFLFLVVGYYLFHNFANKNQPFNLSKPY